MLTLLSCSSPVLSSCIISARRERNTGVGQDFAGRVSRSAQGAAKQKQASQYKWVPDLKGGIAGMAK